MVSLNESELLSQDQESTETDTIKYYRELELFNQSSYFGKNRSISLFYDRNIHLTLLEEQEDGSIIEILKANVTGIDEVANNKIARSGNATRLKVTLNFELTRSGLVNIFKADAGMTETYSYEEKPPKKKISKTDKKSSAKGKNKTAEEKPEKE